MCTLPCVPLQAEQALAKMQAQGFRPREYAYCGLIAAYSLAGQHDKALAVRARARQDGLQVSLWACSVCVSVCGGGGPRPVRVRQPLR